MVPVGVGAELQPIIFTLVWARQLLPPARSFFRNVDGGADLPLTAPGKAGERKPLPINDLRARAVLVDMASSARWADFVAAMSGCMWLRIGGCGPLSAREAWHGCAPSCLGATPAVPARVQEEGVVNSILRGPLAELFDSRQLLTDVSGAGNNWAVGNCVYGPQYRDSLSSVIRSQARCWTS